MKKFFFAFFIFFNLASIPEVIKNFLQEKENKKKEEINNNTISKSSIDDRIKNFTQEINYPLLNKDEFLSKEHIKKINEIFFKISDSEKQEKIFMELHSLRRAIYLDKIQEKKEKMLSSLSNVNDLFLAYNVIPELEVLVHNYLFSFLLDQESFVDAFLENKKKDELQKNLAKLQFIFKNNTFFPMLMDLICTQVNACGSHMFLQKEGNTIKIYDFFEQSVKPNIEFFTPEITQKYQNLYKTKNEIFNKGSKFEGDRQKYFTEIYANIIEKLNIESKYPIVYNIENLTEQEFFMQVLNKIIYNFAEQYIEEIPFNNNLLETLILIDNPKKHQYSDINYIKIPTEKKLGSFDAPFFYNNVTKGNPRLDQTELKKDLSLTKTTQSKNKKKSKFSTTDYCLIGGTIIFIAYIYLYKKTKIDHL